MHFDSISSLAPIWLPYLALFLSAGAFARGFIDGTDAWYLYRLRDLEVRNPVLASLAAQAPDFRTPKRLAIFSGLWVLLGSMLVATAVILS